jgi:hypothetical protein
MTKTLTFEQEAPALDARNRPVGLGGRAVDLNSGVLCVVLDYCPELGPESLYVQSAEGVGPALAWWVSPTSLMALPRDAAGVGKPPPAHSRRRRE